MSYGANILINPSAETQDTTGWTIDPVGSVIVEENITDETRYIPFADDYEQWTDLQHLFILKGAAGDYCFVFASDGDAEMSQILYASDIGAQPTTFQVICKFKLDNEQNRWDNTVFGFSTLKISYDDSTFDYFHIPFVVGIKTSTRYLTNFWVLVQTICEVNASKTLDYVQVSAKSSDFIYGLKIDYIELRKEE
jgi:hypothetical protein